MHDALYFPIHRAKKGEIAAVGHLSPKTLTRVRPTFEVQKPASEREVRLEEYLAGVAAEIAGAWDHRFPLFADFPHFSPEDRTLDGRHCVEHFFKCLRQHGMIAIPMTGPESVRGPGYGYLEAVASIAAVDKQGVALRFPADEFGDVARLENGIRDSLRVLKLESHSVDLFLDLEAIVFLPEQYRSVEGLLSLLVEPVRHAIPYGFRNIVITGSCIPERVDKRFNGRAMRVQRVDLLAWQALVKMIPEYVVKRGDSGIVFALEQDVTGPARPPARIRLSTAGEYVLWRAPRKDYVSLSEQVVKTGDFNPQTDAWGATVLQQCARYGREKGGPTEWIARDTNLSTEVTVQAMEAYLAGLGRLDHLEFANPDSFAWNQTSISSDAAPNS